jgi:cellulose/xylan binding protein with CBM9 domain
MRSVTGGGAGAVALVLAALAWGVGCVDKDSEKVDEAYVKQNLLSAPPTPKVPVNANLGGKVTYLGADVDRDRVIPGGTIQVVHYWKVVQPPGPDWRVFTHLDGGDKEWINVDETKMRKNYGPDKWKAGDIVRDEQSIPVPRTWKGAEVTVHVGLYKKGGATEKDRIAILSGKTDGHGRLVALRLPLTASMRTPLYDYVVRRATGPITPDGKDDEADWKTAPVTAAFVDATGGRHVDGEAHARFLWDDKNLYAFIDVKDKDVASPYTKHDDPLWGADAVELFIDADKDGHDYVELQVNPRNATFDSWLAAPRQGDEKWDSHMVTGTTVEGTLDDRDDTDVGWHAELAIPLEAVKGAKADMKVQLPPRVGDTWRLNVVRVDKGKDDKTVAASSWAQITIQDFHAIDRLRTVAFGDEKGNVAAAAESQPAGSAPGSAPATAPASQPASAPAAETK